MIVYKFGGASVRSASGIENISKIVAKVNEPLFIIVSAMGKTTNALEVVHEQFMKADKQQAKEKINEIKWYHFDVCNELFEENTIVFDKVKQLFSQLEQIITEGVGTDFDRWYDRIVSFGEIISTTIISEYLNVKGLNNDWLDMRELLVTDSNFREANVNLKEAKKRVEEAVEKSSYHLYISQGFIGTNKQGEPTTLGREGSDYS